VEIQTDALPREHPVASIVQAWTLLEIRLKSLKPRCTSLN